MPPAALLTRSIQPGHLSTVGVGGKAWGGASLRDTRVFQPPKKEKVEDREPSGLSTLFPGQRRRVSHLSRHGKEVRPWGPQFVGQG